jgi:colanic acid/amylovoran biosynthesis glycosyltransferase
MRIAFFVGSFPVVSETFILRQITGLIDLGHEVDVFAERRPDRAGPIHPEVTSYGLLDRTTYTDEDMPEATGYWQMPVWPITGRTWLPGEERPLWNVARVVQALPTFLRCLRSAPGVAFHVLDPREYGYQALSLATLYRLGTLCCRRRYDVLHAHFGPQGNAFRFARKLWDAPYVVSFHGFDFCTLPRQQGEGMYAQLFDTADVVTVNSDYTRKRVEALSCPPAKLVRLPVGLNPDDFPFRERVPRPGEPIRILTVARLVEIKGHEHVIRAVARVRERHPNVRYDIVGEGPLRPKLENLVEELRLRDSVTLHGARDSHGVRRFMAEAHLFLLGSVTVDGDAEGQGLVLQEAQASGLPVVATSHGAFPEGLLPGKSGFLVPERDVNALAAQLSALVTNAETWPELGRRGRNYVEERYDVRKLNLRLADLYASVLRTRRRGF